jgi:alkyl hydroperoxide reductase subunit AhpC
MALRLGDLAPDFTAETTFGLTRFRDWKRGSWAVLFPILATSRRCARPSWARSRS